MAALIRSRLGTRREDGAEGAMTEAALLLAAGRLWRDVLRRGFWV